MRGQQYADYIGMDIRFCPQRRRCPLGTLCALPSDRLPSPLVPVVERLERGSLLWTDLLSRQRVFVVREGALLCRIYASESREEPYGIFGPGIAAGLPELFVTLRASDIYFLQSLVPSSICTFSPQDVRAALEGTSVAAAQSIAAHAHINQSIANYGQFLTMAHRGVRDRVVSTLLRLASVFGRGTNADADRAEGAVVLPVTQGDIALIAGAERCSVTRSLRDLREEGLVDTGYRDIVAHAALFDRYADYPEANLNFHQVLS